MRKFDRLKSITVLYVEDSKFLLKITRSMMENIFLKVFSAQDGQEGLEIYQAHRQEIDLIITDLIMPTLDGASMVKAIRESKSDVPIIITTGFDDFLERERMIELSIDGFLSKPVDMLKLLKSVNKIVDTLFTRRELETKKRMIDNDIIYSEMDEFGYIKYVSKPFEKLSGYTKEELIGKSHTIFKATHDSKSCQDIWPTLKAQKQWQGEIENRAKDGSLYRLQCVVSPMYFRDKLIGYSSTSIDITQLHQKSLELEAQSKHAALGEMISMIAHQWRQPITSIGIISGNLQFDLMMDEVDKVTIEESLKQIDKHVRYLSNTIDIFSDFLKGNQKRDDIFSICDAVQEAILTIKEQCLKRGIEIDFVKNCNSFKIEISKNEFIQSILHILTNAMEAFLDKKIQNPKIEIFIYETKRGFDIKISDNAGGIKEEYLGKIFTPYFSTKLDKNGTGLGLYITKTIVEKKLKGTIEVKNSIQGVDFIVSLPKMEKEVAYE